MPQKEAKARIKINKLLEESGWRLLDGPQGKANVLFESHVKITQKDQDSLGEDFENTKNGYADYLLFDEKGYSLIVLQAKSESKNPLVGKEQARKYVKSQNCRFVLLSNGNIHYFWDLEKGSPYIITRFPEPHSVKGYSSFKPNPDRLINELVKDDYIALTQKPNYADDPNWKDEDTREDFIDVHKLKFLRPYQIKAVNSIQHSVKEGKDRFLFEMATGTGKTLTSAAIIKLFLRTGNASRVLFLVDRLELEDQAEKAFGKYLIPDYTTVIYKEKREEWHRAEIVVTTVFAVSQNHAAKLTQVFNQMADKMYPEKYNSDFAVQVTSAISDAQQFTINFSDKSNNLMGTANFLDWSLILKGVEKEVVDAENEGDYPEVRFLNLKDGMRFPVGTDLTVELDATDKHGIKEKKLYLNGLLLKAHETKPHTWNAESDELLKALKTGRYHLKAVAEDNTGTLVWQEIQIIAGDVSDNNETNMDAEIRQVILNEGERLTDKDVRIFPRLECYLILQEDGRLTLRHGTPDNNKGEIWYTSMHKDPSGDPMYSVVENGQLTTWRVRSENPKVKLYQSPLVSGPGPYKLGITVSKKLVVLRESEGKEREIVWMGN